MADDPPKLRLASENPDATIAQQRAFDLLSWPLRELTANLLRITRGAGNPHKLVEQLSNLLVALEEAFEHPDFYRIPSIMADTLHSAMPPWDLAEEEFDDAGGQIIGGSLQYIASRLVYQHMQEAAGSSEIRRGLREAMRARDERLERLRMEDAAWLRKERARQNPRKPKPKASVSCKLVERPPAPKPKAKPSTVVDERPTSTAEFMRRRAEELGS